MRRWFNTLLLELVQFNLNRHIYLERMVNYDAPYGLCKCFTVFCHSKQILDIQHLVHCSFSFVWEMLE